VEPGQTVGHFGPHRVWAKAPWFSSWPASTYEQGSIKVDGVELKRDRSALDPKQRGRCPRNLSLFAKDDQGEHHLWPAAMCPTMSFMAICQEAAIHDVILTF